MSRISLFAFALLTSISMGCLDGDAPTPIGAEQPTHDEFLFGYTAEELLAIKRVSLRPITDEAWLDAHRGTFSCERYGDLCKLVGEAYARKTIEEGYRVALATGDVDAVRAAQRALIDIGKVEHSLEADRNLRDTEDDCEFGTSNGSYRLCATATATKLWPSGEFRADGNCKTQVNAFGWQVKNSDFIDGELRANFCDNAGCDLDVRTPAAIFNDNRLNFTEFQQSANSVTVTVECEANDGPTWSATADVVNFTS